MTARRTLAYLVASILVAGACTEPKAGDHPKTGVRGGGVVGGESGSVGEGGTSGMAGGSGGSTGGAGSGGAGSGGTIGGAGSGGAGDGAAGSGGAASGGGTGGMLRDGGVDAMTPDGGPRCLSGQHLCENQCLDDSSPMSCGTSCTPCVAPGGGSASCDGTSCKGTCPTGRKLCLGLCIPMGQSCNGQCPSGTHDCSGLCLDDKSVNSCGAACTPCPAPANGNATCTGGTCGITCKAGFTLERQACIDSKQVPCDPDNANPLHSTDVSANVTITWSPTGGWTAPAKCAWTCDSNYTKDGNACVDSKQVPCDSDNANPLHSTDVSANVTVTWSAAGGWTAPSKCAWTCDNNYAKDGNTCINSKQVACTSGGNPSKSTQTTGMLVTVSYTTAGGWSTPAVCPWTCNMYYAPSGGTAEMPAACLEPIYVFPAAKPAGAIGDGTAAVARTNANALCAQAAAGLSFPRTKIVAFISVSATDEIRDLPSTAGVPTNRVLVGWRTSTSPGRPPANTIGASIANDWADLLDGTIQRSFNNAGIYNDQSPSNWNNWFSGSDSAGALGQNCSTWSPSANTTNTGNYGNPYGADSTTPGQHWMDNPTGGCDGTYDVLCLGYTP